MTTVMTLIILGVLVWVVYTAMQTRLDHDIAQEEAVEEPPPEPAVLLWDNLQESAMGTGGAMPETLPGYLLTVTLPQYVRRGKARENIAYEESLVSFEDLENAELRRSLLEDILELKRVFVNDLSFYRNMYKRIDQVPRAEQALASMGFHVRGWVVGRILTVEVRTHNQVCYADKTGLPVAEVNGAKEVCESYDLETGEPVTLEQLFFDEADYGALLNRGIQAAARGDRRGDFKAPFTALPVGYNAFKLTPQALGIRFIQGNPYLQPEKSFPVDPVVELPLADVCRSMSPVWSDPETYFRREAEVKCHGLENTGIQLARIGLAVPERFERVGSVDLTGVRLTAGAEEKVMDKVNWELEGIEESILDLTAFPADAFVHSSRMNKFRLDCETSRIGGILSVSYDIQFGYEGLFSPSESFSLCITFDLETGGAMRLGDMLAPDVEAGVLKSAGLDREALDTTNFFISSRNYFELYVPGYKPEHMELIKAGAYRLDRFQQKVSITEDVTKP